MGVHKVICIPEMIGVGGIPGKSDIFSVHGGDGDAYFSLPEINFAPLFVVFIKDVAVVDGVINVIGMVAGGIVVQRKQIIKHGAVIHIVFIDAEIHAARVIQENVTVLFGIHLVNIRIFGKQGGDEKDKRTDNKKERF